MKRIIMAFAASMVMSYSVMAQNDGNGNRKPMDKAEMVKKRTEAVAAKYGLNEEQTKKLNELNMAYADSMRFGMGQRGNRGQGQGMRHRGPGQQKVAKDTTSQRRMPAERMGNRGDARRMDMSATMKNYNDKLKEIMTQEQYDKYTADMKKRMERPERNGNGMRK